jgi:hypothetical protein
MHVPNGRAGLVWKRHWRVGDERLEEVGRSVVRLLVDLGSAAWGSE